MLISYKMWQKKKKWKLRNYIKFNRLTNYRIKLYIDESITLIYMVFIYWTNITIKKNHFFNLQRIQFYIIIAF